jgi:hypothetical protein
MEGNERYLDPVTAKRIVGREPGMQVAAWNDPVRSEG